MTMMRIVVLANSWKHQDWCLAGIDLDTGKWVRPVTQLDDGRVPLDSMKLGGYVPQLLDVLEIPLDSTGPDFDFECENRTILPGKWFLVDKLTYKDVEKYVKHSFCVLHNHKKYVLPHELYAKPFQERQTLQLIRTHCFMVLDDSDQSSEKHNWKGIIFSAGRTIEVKITDPVFSEKLNNGHKHSPFCLLTMSLSMPYKPLDWPEHRQPACWKLISGVIELNE